MLQHLSLYEGILPVDKPGGITSFDLVRWARRRLNIKKIGHAGTLDPFATGVVILLIGKTYTRMSDQFLGEDKVYEAVMRLGAETDTYDSEGTIVAQNTRIPDLKEIMECLQQFEGIVEQVPPMFSAKKVNGQKLYHLARKGEIIERKPQQVSVHLTDICYAYPDLHFTVACSKGTYIRSIAHDVGKKLRVGGYLNVLRRVRSGSFSIEQCVPAGLLKEETYPIEKHIIKSSV